MNGPFNNSLSQIHGSSWLDEAARSSLRAAQHKFVGSPLESTLKVEITGQRPIGVHDAALISIALQSATAKLGHFIRDPSQEWTQARRRDRKEAMLIPRVQIGTTMIFGFPKPYDRPEEPMLVEQPGRSLSETAALELCELLPTSADDDAALDGILGQRTTVRSAVSDIVSAVNEISTGFSLELTATGLEQVHSSITLDQASVLKDSLRQTRTDKRIQQVVGRLDGLRTKRRIFYFELDSGGEISGAIGADPELMTNVRANLGSRVIATVESEQVESLAGRRGRPVYLLTGLQAEPTLFDTE